MLKKRKKVKIIMTIMALIVTLGLFINCKKININKETYAPTMNLATAQEIRLAATTIGLEHGTINPIYRPKWEKVSSSIDTTNKTVTVKVKGYAYENQTLNANAKIDYASDVESTLSSENITVFFDGVEVTSKTNPKITVANKTVTHNAVSNKDEVTYDITLSNLEEAARQAGKPYKEWSGNIALKIGGRGESSSTYNANVLTDQYKNQNMMELDGKNSSWIDVKIEDTKTDKNASGTMFADYIKPEFTYVYSDGNINYTNKTLTVDFSVVDKYFSSTTLSAQNAADGIRVSLTDTNPASQIPDAKITKELTKVSDVTEKRDGVDVKIGEKYRLVIKGLQQQTADGKYRDYSGPMSISIPAGVATDKSGNKSIATTFSIGVNEPGGSSDEQKIVDVVDPLWKTENINIDHTNKVVTLDLVGTDKYYASNSLTTNSIKVIIDGEEVTTTANVKKSLSAATPLTETRNGTSVQYGVRYTLTLSDWEEATKQTGKQFFEWSGTTKIQVAAGTITDQYTNKSQKQEFTLGHVDFIKPKIEKVSFAKDSTAKTETIIFNVIDKYLDVSDKVTTDEISVYVDGELVPSSQITRTLTKISDLTGTVNETTKVIGHQYKLVLSNFEQKRTAINYNREYSDWSGNVKIKIAEGAVKDTNSPTPNKNEATEIKADDSDAKKDFVDFVKPNATYKFSSSDINYDGKTFTMVFDVTDKYYSSGTLSINDLDIKIDGETPNWDSTGIHGVVKELSVTDRSNSISITENGVVKAVTKVIGKRYTLKLSHLEQLEKLQGKDTMDYSGVITVAVAKDKFADISENKNNAFTITSGIDIAGEKLGTDGKVVDVVDPIWEKISSSASAAEQTATITVKGTDKYFKASSLNANLIKVFVDGKEVTTGITKTVGTSSPAYGSDKTTRIGDQYTITISGAGLTKNAKQIKIQIQPNAITDTSNNTNKATDLLLYNTLVNTSSEPAANSGFLGSKNSENTNVSKIERQNIENVTFMDNIPSSVYDKSAKAYVDTTAWDVSAQQDKSILAWYTTNANGTLNVYIGSDDEIFGNYDSSNLFAYIGYSEEDKFTATETISNIGLLNVSSVTNMSYMFRQTGYNAMTKLDLGDNFDTSNVTNMTAMFRYTGNSKMLTFNLGSKFNTSKVTNMQAMFYDTGFTAMTSLDLGDKFDTSKVTDMSYMFKSTGYTAMTSLDLGDNFDTSNVTNTERMFSECGARALGSIDLGTKFDTSNVTNMNCMFASLGMDKLSKFSLGDKFDTSKVTDMRWMFSELGKNSLETLDLGNKFDTSNVTTMQGMFNMTGMKNMKSLDLGDKFDTSKVTDMSWMFCQTGQNSMTSLDLGPAFTKIPSGDTQHFDNPEIYKAYYLMFSNTGKSGCVIHAPESIFQDKNNFKLNASATTGTVNYTRGTINPKYRTEWIKQASQITIDNNDLANSKINITLRGMTNPDAGKDFTSNVESSLSNEKINDQIKVYIDGEEATSITKQVAAATEATNETTGAKDVVQVLTLSNFEEALRQKGKNYKEWSGNISLKIAKKTLKDTTYQNQNLQAIDTSGTMEDIILKGTGTESTNNKTSTTTMFTDYIRPEFTYEAANTIIDQGKKNVTVVFDITDKYFQSSKIDLTTMTIKVDGEEPDWTKVTRVFNKKQIAADVTEGNIIYRANGDIYTTVNGKQVKIGERYELIVNGLETKNGEGYSGPMTIAFPAGELNTDGTIKQGIVDKSGNLNSAKTITIGIDDPENHEDHKGPDIVDVVNPVWTYGTSSINRIRDGETADTVELTIIGSDKYYKSNSLTEDKIKVYVDDKLESSITKDLVSITDTATLKQLATEQGLADVDNVKLIGYKLTLGNFGKINGVTKIVIDAGTIVDNSGNVNLETTILVGNKEWVEKGDSSTNQKYPAFRNSIVDFTRPTWEYSTSSITRDRDGETGTVTVKILGRDIYYLKDTLTENNIDVFVANSKNPNVPITTITKKLTKITNTAELDGADTGYNLTLGNFGTYDGAVKIKIAENSIRDTSGNGNKQTEISVGNKNWVEKDIGDNENSPKYTAFRNSVVDFIKPTIKYKYKEGVNPLIDSTNKQVSITFDVVDTNFLESNILTADDIKQILVDDMDVTDYITKNLTKADITDGSGNGVRYTLTLSNFELDKNLENEIFRRHSGKIEFVIAAGKVKDTSGNENIETKIIVDNDNGDDANNFIKVDFIKPKLFYVDKDISYAQRYATVTIAGTDRFYDFNTKLTAEDITIYELNRNGEYVQRTDLPISITPVKTKYGYNFVIKISEFEEEFKKLKISIPAGKIADTGGLTNEATDIIVDLDNKKPVWKYMSTDTSKFENDGTISFNVKGQDTFLVLDQSNLTDANVKIFKDGKDVAGATAKVTSLGEDANEISKSYKIDITGLKEIGNYSLVIEKETLVDEFDNKSNTTTISFSKSAISSNTDNYTMITYHTSPDFKETHQSYVHELMSVNESGTNAESTTYRASSIGEIYGDGKNAQFAEPFGYSFKGWAVANNKGFSADDAKIYSLYDDIPNTVTHLNAIWQKATVIFVSKSGNNSNDGLSPEKPVKDLQTAYGKLNSSGKSSENIIVIMDAVEWNSSDKLTGNATITSLYAGVDYRTKGAELKVSSNMNIEGDVAFDNIKLYSSSTKVSDGSDYLSKGDYSNVLITNYGDVTLGRGISTPDDKYTFGAVVGGNYKTEAKLGTIGIHTVIVEAGKYNNIIAGSSLETQTTKSKYVSHQVMIGTMKESAVSRNEKLTITGYLAMGESEDGCYPYNTNGSQSTTTAYSMKYSITKIYSAKFTGENKFNKSSENASIYLRTIDGFNDGINEFYMYGGEVTGNVYGGSRAKVKKDPTGSEPIANELNFYGGQITGDIFGNGNKNFSIGSSTITLSGRIAITGNVFGGSNTDTEAQGQVSGNTNIIVNSGITVNGNIYGGSKGVINGTSINVNTGAINGNTNITLNTGTIKGDIYGGGQNGGVSDSANININNGQVTGNIYGGAYQNQVRTQSNINILGGTVQNVYGGNILTTSGQQNNDTVSQNVNIVIGSKDVNTTPTIKGTVYGSGKYERVGTVEIQLVKSAKLATIYGGSDEAGITNEVNIYLKGITANTIYGGSKTDGIVTTANIFLQSGTVTDVYGGGYGGTTTTANVTLEGTANVTSLFGGSNTNGTVETSNVELKSGKLLNVYGGGNSVAVETANVTLDGITIDEIHGGSKNAGITTNTNVVLNTGKVTDVFGGGYDVGVTNAKVTQNGATVTNIYGGNQGGTGNGGDTDNATVNIAGKTANNIYGGNKEKGTTKNATINITGASTITGKLYGGGYKSAIGKSGNTGSTTINITGGTIENDINGGSEDSIVYGTTNINVGKDTVTDDTLVAGNINIKGNIYGAGSTANDNFDTVSVYGATHVTIDGSTASPITFANSVFGAGKGSTYETTDKKGADKSTVKIKDLGTSTNAYKMISIQRTGKVSVQNSYLELTGAQDANNYYKRASYTLNRVTNGLTLLDNSTLYTQRAFNMVGGFESLVTNEYGTTIKETVSIENGTVTRNVDNRLYTLEGVNLIFAKQEGNLEDRSNEDIWGDVKGMAFFGMYRTSRTTGAKEYDIYAPDYAGTASTKMFANGTYVEGRHKSKHNITVDGFYSNIADDTGIAKPQVIDVTDYGTYYDWIIGADVVNYATSLIASTYSTYSMADLQLDLSKVINNPTYSGTSLTLNRVSSNALNTDINLIDRYTVPTYSENANNTFGMTMETTHSGWTKGGITELYTDSDGSFGGTSFYRMDNSGNPGTITFKLFNSVNVSETKDLGFVNIVFTGKSRSADDPSVGNTFKVVIAVNIQSLYEEESKNYVPRFTNSIDTELNYTTDSSVDISYVLYEVGLGAQSDIYATDDYRVLSTSTPLPKGTKVTLRDYGQGDNVNKVYYYQVASDTDYDATDNSSGSTRYLYKLSKFIDMGGTTSKTAKYANNNSQYYHSGSNGGYALEKYEVSFNFIDSNINANKIAQETYLELRSSSGSKKYGNGQKNLKYNMYTDKANLTETVVTDNGTTSYTVFENLSIPFKFDASLLEQKVADGKTIMDTKYYDKKLGMAIEIVDEHGERIKAPELQNFKLTDKTDATVYPAGADGVIRVPLSDNLAELSNSYELAMTQSSVSAGQYIAKIYFFASDDGIHYGGEEVASQEIYITFINKLLGLAGIETADGSRIVNKETGLNLDGGDGLDLTVKVGSPTNDTNIRVELYKRNDTYTTAEDGTKTYNGISYTKVDLKDYLKSLDGTELKTPEQCTGQNLVTASGGKEYIVMEKKEHPTSTDNEYVENVEFKKLLKEGISTGEYKLVFKAYYNNTLIQEIRKSFIVE